MNLTSVISGGDMLASRNGHLTSGERVHPRHILNTRLSDPSQPVWTSGKSEVLPLPGLKLRQLCRQACGPVAIPTVKVTTRNEILPTHTNTTCNPH